MPLSIEHVLLRVPDLTTTVKFYRDVFGLAEIARKDDMVYLGCGRDENFDLGVTEGTPGFEHFALRVANIDKIDAAATTLESAGTQFKRSNGEHPGITAALRFRLPSGVPIELVTVANSDYPHDEAVAIPERADRAPISLDHVNLSSPCIHDDVAFLRDIVGMNLSEVIGTQDNWNLAFMRCGDEHHDVALAAIPSMDQVGVHHVAWEYTSIQHMKQLIDRITQANISLERGLGRHHAGNNLYAYFRPPGRIRIEILAEMESVYTDEFRFVKDYDKASVAWGDEAPDSFSKTSPVTGTLWN